MEWLIGFAVVGVAILLVRRWAKNVPMCVCGREDCGGGCWNRKD